MKGLVGVALGFATILGIQQYQLNKISDAVADIQTDLKFVTQSPEAIVSYSEKDEACLARNIYYEAGVEGERGKYAVAQVTINRVKTGRWGKSICEVVHAKSQFSWTLKKKLNKPKGQAWEDSQWVAHRALRGDQVPSLKTAMFYHADYVKSPNWTIAMAEVARVGQHIFYTKAKIKKA